MIFYNLMTLNAAAMLDIEAVEFTGKTDKHCLEFRYDLSEVSIKRLILSSTDRHADTALFYQLIETRYGVEKLGQYRGEYDCIRKSLVYLDFEDVFSPKKKLENKLNGNEYHIYKLEECELDGICSVFFKNGFTIVHEDGETKTYVPFDKSGNMSRNYSITFVDKELFPEIDLRLRLGIDFSSINVIPSKYFSYRGLYLTDGVRVAEDEAHILDHKTVLVLDDDFHDYMQGGKAQEVPVITADIGLLKNKRILKGTEKTHRIHLNSFDGEGLVSPYFAEYMGRAYQKEIRIKNIPVSFQVRMPFTKGMLHKVDFHKFIREQMPEKDYYIKDIFGIPRRMDDVQVIFTKSMFKCAKWLEEFSKKSPEIKDPMEWFFNAFHQYNHGLYVINTDANMGSRKISLSYQFINTLDLDGAELEKLVRRHLNEAHSIPETGDKYAVDINEYPGFSINADEDEKEVNDEWADDDKAALSMPAWRYALGMNRDFVKEPFVKTRLELDEASRVKDVCFGRIIVDGGLKYLSGDLLALLIHMIYNRKTKNNNGIGGVNGLGVLTKDGFRIDETGNKNIVEKLKKQLVRTGKFYTADHAGLDLKINNRYGIFRSPHLSRNEQCSLRPYIPEKEDEKNIYNIYFSHLKNVIMFAYESIDALSLGGADFDGDKVLLVLDQNINSAILKGAYALKGKDYVRKLPIVEIPSPGANSKPAPGIIPYELVKNTFSNQVGRISDLAIKIGKKEYTTDIKDVSLKNKCAECTLATGLEIDAVKTGIRPDLKDILESAPKEEDYFLKRMRKIKNYDEIRRLKVHKKGTGKNGGDLFIAEFLVGRKGKRQSNKLIDAELMPIGKTIPNNDRLPGYFLQDLSGERKKESGPETDSKKTHTKELLLFKFQTDEVTGNQDYTWSTNLKKMSGPKEKLDRVSALIKAYCKVRDDAKYIRNQRKYAESSGYIHKIWFLLMEMYDMSVEGLPVTHTAIPAAIEMARIDIRGKFDSIKGVNHAIKNMKDVDWITTAAEEREAVLYNILGTDRLLDETKEILLSDEQDAFNFLIFYLYQIKKDITLESSVEEMLQNKQKEKRYYEGYSQDDYKIMLLEYVTGDNNKETKRVWNSRIIKYCRERLAAKDMFNNDFDCALKYCYASHADPNNNFLWDVFRPEEILRNVYQKKE